jgi:hypothetical protein
MVAVEYGVMLDVRAWIWLSMNVQSAFVYTIMEGTMDGEHIVPGVRGRRAVAGDLVSCTLDEAPF